MTSPPSRSPKQISSATLLLAAVSIMLLAFSLVLAFQIRNLSRSIARQDATLTNALAIATAGDAHSFNAQHARVVVSRSRGLLLVASGLPRLAPGKAFQLWFAPQNQRGPVFNATDKQDAILVSAPPSNASALIVTVEDESGSSQPTGAAVLTVSFQQ